MVRLIPWAVALALAVAGFAAARAERGPAAAAIAEGWDYLPAAEPPQHAPMDHGEKNHHHHLHNADHGGNGHTPKGLGDHHHHPHAHPHPADPHHHHPH